MQDIIIEKWSDDLRLTLNGDLQFSFKEDSIYTNAMTEVPMEFLENRKNVRVLILGWWDGFIADRIRTFPNVISIDLCEIDTGMIKLCSTDSDIKEFNHEIFADPILQIHIEDAYTWVQGCKNTYDLIIAVFPDAHAIELSKLYSLEFYASLSQILQVEGIFITLGSEIHHTPSCFESIIKTLQEIFSYSLPFSIEMPETYGTMWIVMVSQSAIFQKNTKIEEYKTKNQDTIEINTLNNSNAYHYFQKETLSSGFIPGITNKK
jgi:spermidine synthase